MQSEVGKRSQWTNRQVCEAVWSHNGFSIAWNYSFTLWGKYWGLAIAYQKYDKAKNQTWERVTCKRKYYKSWKRKKVWGMVTD